MPSIQGPRCSPLNLSPSTPTGSMTGAEMAFQPLNRLLQHLGALAEGEPRIMRGRPGLVIEGGHGDRGDARVLGDMTAERDIVAVEPKRRKVRGDEIGPMGRQNIKPDFSETGRQLVAPGP